MPRALASAAALVLCLGACTTPQPTATVTATATPPSASGAPSLDCAVPEEGTVSWVACNVLDGLRSRNTAALLSFMTEPFALGFWESEWQPLSPDEAVARIGTLLPADTSIDMPYTTDRAALPPLGGSAPEQLLTTVDTVALVIYSRGWGTDGSGAALLYFTERAGAYAWGGLLYAPTGF
jgi:hypothetical protein